SRKRVRIRSFSSIPRRQRQRSRFSAAWSMLTRTPGSHRTLDHDLPDLADRARWIEPFRADIDAIHDRVATKQPVGVLEVVETLVRRLVSRVGDEAICLQEPGGADELVRVPPEGRASRGAAG